MTDSNGRMPSRRELLQLGAGLLVLGGIGVRARTQRRTIRHSIYSMGTTAELAVVHRDEAFAKRALEAAAAELRRVESLMSRFDRNSDIGRANARAGQGRTAVSPETAHVVRRALEWARASDGAFEPAILRVMSAWDVTTRQSPPAHETIARLANRHFFRSIDVAGEDDAAWLSIADPDAMLDLGGIAAGYGVDRAVTVLRNWGITDGFVNVSGDIYALGHTQEDEPWKIGIRSPSDPNALVGTVSVRDGAIATSGDYEQGFTYNGRRYHHIMDPATAEPRISARHSVTITAPSCIEADAATTAVFGWPAEVAQRLLDRCSPGAQLVSSV